ncbi:MAG TPA: enoyl-CoA hydratase/isomerase family protein, partial [Bacteroidota bacterium]|nr:enoyl-CoA hydratase/isomerase family protein [Bacteroidota bacterium]
MNYSSLTYSVEGRTAVITFNKPDRRNALDDVMIQEITELFTVVNRNTSVRVIVVTGAGTSFCAGMD